MRVSVSKGGGYYDLFDNHELVATVRGKDAADRFVETGEVE